MKLSEAERWELVDRLLHSLEGNDEAEDEGREDDHEAAWTVEIDRRMREIEEGKVALYRCRRGVPAVV